LSRNTRHVLPALCLSVGFFGLLVALVLLGRISVFVAGGYGLISLAAFVMVYLDKSAASRAARRIPEKNLHLVELAGGWPGALVAQRLFRHKTSKRAYQIVFWCAVAMNCAALAWLLYGESAFISP